MNLTKTLRTRRSFLLLAGLICLLLLAASDQLMEMRADATVQGSAGRSSAIKAAPPAPVFDEATRHRELAGRRARVAQMVGPNGILILMSGEPRVYAGDVNYHYRQENNLYYLTNLKQNGATLMLTPGNEALPEILFLPRRNPLRETWTGHMYTVEEASRASGIKEIWDAREFEPFTRALRNRQPYQPKPENVLMTAARAGVLETPEGVARTFERLFTDATKSQALLFMLTFGETERRFATEWVNTVPGATPSTATAVTPPLITVPRPSPIGQSAAEPLASASGYVVKDASYIFASLRLRKSPMELALMQHAIDITIEAIERSWVAAAEAKWEYEIDAVVLYTFKLRNADSWGYPPIVGCGPNATTLHYEESQGPVRPNDLFLMDVGAEYEHYTADVTRTFPVNGKFNPAQAEIYQIVFDAQEAGAKMARPGKFVSDVDRAATEVIKDGLLKLGLITSRESNQHRLWFMHGTSHWLGMNVHDVGFYGTRLEPGMVFTNEPGIYIRADALDIMPSGWAPADWEKFKTAVRPAFERYKNMGVRIEDDLLVTGGEVEWMTKALPRKMSEIEEFIARARREAR